MAMTPDQQATLQLLLERGQSYADLARLLGEDEDEVRARARAALTELGGADPDRNVGLTDYLLGQADPIGRADAVPPPARRPRRPRAGRASSASTLRAIVPGGRAAAAARRARAAAAPLRARRRRPMTARGRAGRAAPVRALGARRRG